MEISGKIKRSEITVGDEIAFEGGTHVSSVCGTVVKASRVNLHVESLYMGRIPLTIKIRRDKPEGKGYISRNGLIYEVED
jgi:hypothetical protein